MSLFISPHKFKSSHWFSPLFVAAVASSAYAFLRENNFKRLGLPTVYIFGLLVFLSVAWFLYSPLIRFILGVLIFITIKQVIFIHKVSTPSPAHSILVSSIVITLVLFIVNVGKHVYEDVIPVINQSPTAVDKFMPWVTTDKNMYTLKRTEDGFMYSRSSTMVCHKMRPPCISRRSLAGDEFLIKEYRRYNRM